jgi:Domain of unknown function (DUF4258)
LESGVSATLAILQTLARRGAVHISSHALERMEKGGITSDVVVRGLETASVVEDYPDAKRGPSVLVLFMDQEQPWHAVWGVSQHLPDLAVLITVYRPDPAQWSQDFRRRL